MNAMLELKTLRDMNLTYQLKLTSLEQDFKTMESHNLELETSLAHYKAKESEQQSKTENYAELRKAWEQLSTHFLEKRSKNIELQRLLFDSRKELANAKALLEQSKHTCANLERELKFINEINSKPDNMKMSSIQENNSLTDSNTFSVSTASLSSKDITTYEKISRRETKIKTVKTQYHGSQPLQNRLLENTRRQDRKSQSLESLNSLERRKLAFGSTAVGLSKLSQKVSNSSVLNRTAKLRQQAAIALPLKAPHCGPGSLRTPNRNPCGPNNGQVYNKPVSASVKSNTSTTSNSYKSQSRTVSGNLTKPSNNKSIVKTVSFHPYR